jgi:hypothetical protein
VIDFCHTQPVKITKRMVAGLVVSLAGNAVAVGVSEAVAIANGGGPNADLDTGEKFGVLIKSVATFSIAQGLLVGICVVLALRLGREASLGLAAGWVLGLAASLFYVCGGFA